MEEIKKLNRKKMRTIFLNEHRKKRKKSKKIENKCDQLLKDKGSSQKSQRSSENSSTIDVDNPY